MKGRFYVRFEIQLVLAIVNFGFALLSATAELAWFWFFMVPWAGCWIYYIVRRELKDARADAVADTLVGLAVMAREKREKGGAS